MIRSVYPKNDNFGKLKTQKYETSGICIKRRCYIFTYTTHWAQVFLYVNTQLYFHISSTAEEELRLTFRALLCCLCF